MSPRSSSRSSSDQGYSHALLVARDPFEVARFVSRLLHDAELRDNTRYIDLGRAVAMPIAHEPDGSCCARESWITTLVQVVAAEARDRAAATPQDAAEAIPAPTDGTLEATVAALADDIDEGRRIGVPLPFTGAEMIAHYRQLLRERPRAAVLADLRRRHDAQGYRVVEPLVFPHPTLARASGE